MFLIININKLTKKVSSFGQGHVPTSSIENETTFTKSNEDSKRFHNDFHKNDESFKGHNSAL